jgi:hypothetical protein
MAMMAMMAVIGPGVMATIAIAQTCRYDHVSKHFDYLKQVFVSNNCNIISVKVHTLDSILYR